MSRLDDLYLKLPPILQTFIVSGYGLCWYYRRFGGKFHRYVKELRRHDSWSSEEMDRYQDEKLERLLKAALRSPFYQEKYRDIPVDKWLASREKTPRQILRELPLVTKEEFRAHSREFLTGTMGSAAIYHSSGSTGTPTKIYRSKEFDRFFAALWEARCRNWAGLSYKSPRLMLGAKKIHPSGSFTPPFWRYNFIEKQYYASIFHINPETLPHYAAFITKKRLDWISGFPSAITLVAEYILKEKIPITTVKAVIPSGETLTDSARDLMAAAFNCKVYDQYSCGEYCLFASTCSSGSRHVSPEAGIIEVMDENGTISETCSSGELVCTGLFNTLQPLIRYRLGDSAEFDRDARCECGRDWPVMKRVIGRVADYVVLRDGRKIQRFHTIFYGLSSIHSCQIVQEALDDFTLNVFTVQQPQAEDLALLVKNFRQLTSSEARVKVVVQEIPTLGAGGKIKSVICKLKDAGVSTATP